MPVQPHGLLGPLRQANWRQIHLLRDWEAPGRFLTAFFPEEGLGDDGVGVDGGVGVDDGLGDTG